MKSLLTLIILSSLSICTIAQIPTNGLVAYYPFNGNANDSSGNNNNGTINAVTPAADRFGNTNSAYSFDGVTSSITIPHSSSLVISNNTFSYSFWVKVNAWQTNTNEYYLFSKHSGSGSTQSGYHSYIYQSALTLRYKNGSASNWGATSSTSNPTAGTWFHVVNTIDNTSNKTYINGTLVDTQPAQIVGANSTNLTIGYDPIGGQHFLGDLDDIRIYNTALTQTEVTQLYNEANSTPPPTNFCYDFTYQTAANEYCSSAIGTSDGGYAFLMTKATSFDIVKTDSLGVIQWQQNHNIGSYGNMNRLIQTSDGGYAAIGTSNLAAYNTGNYCSGVVLKFSSTGAIQWSRQLSGISYGENNGTDIIQNTNGEFICAATIQHHGDYGGSVEYVAAIIKLSASGTIIWNKGISSTNGAGIGVELLSGNSYLVTGNTNGVYGTGYSDMLLAKYNDSGTQLFIKSFNYAANSGSNLERSTKAVVTSTGDIYVAGWSTSGTDRQTIIRCDLNGN